MGMFTGKAEAPSTEQKEAPSMGQAQASGVKDEASFLDAFEGEGIESLHKVKGSLPFLNILAPTSKAVESGEQPVGTFYVSSTGKNYGKDLTCAVVAHTISWEEKDGVGHTVSRSAPHGMPFIERKDKPTDKYPTMYHKETGNKIDEAQVFVLVPAYTPEDGFVIFIDGPGSRRTTTRLAQAIRSAKNPVSGKTLPIFANIWELKIDKQVSKNTGKDYYGLMDFRKVGTITKEFLDKALLPVRSIVSNTSALLLAAPVESSEE